MDSRIRQYTNINESQFGFMPGRSTTDAIFILKQTIVKPKEGQNNIRVTFIDLEKCIRPHTQGGDMGMLKGTKCAEKYIRLVQDMYRGCKTVVRSAAGGEKQLWVDVVLHQCSALSPYLFLLLMDVLTEDVRKDVPGSMMFADVIVLCGDDETDMTEYLETWRRALDDRGMSISRPKTQFIDFKFGLDNGQGREPVKILGEELQRVHHFNYIGSSVEDTGGMTTYISQRVSAAWGNWKRCSGVRCDRRMPVKLKGKVYETVVRPALLYGAETWATTRGQEAQLEVNEMRMLRWMCGVTRRDSIRNEYIRGTTRVVQASKKITEKRLKWYGHVKRMKEEHIVRRMLDVEIPGKRRRGRPNLRWKDASKRDMTKLGMKEDNTTNRAAWRKKIISLTGDPR